MMKADSEKVLTAEQQEDLDKRIASHKKGESKSYSWSEARAQIEKRFKITGMLNLASNLEHRTMNLNEGG